MKTLTQRVDLHRAFHHHGPAHERALRRHPGAVPLVAAHVGQPGTEFAAPAEGAAVVAHMAGKNRLAHRRQQLADHAGVAAKTVAGQDQRVASQMFHAAVRPLVAHTNDPVLVGQPQLTHQGIGQHVSAGGTGDLLKPRHQRRASAFGQRMHAAHAVAGVQKAVQHFKADAVLLQRVNGRADRLRIGAHQVRRGLAMRLGLNVLGKGFAGVVDAQRLLQARAGRRDEARGQRCRAAGHGIAFEQYAVQASVAQAHGRRQAAGTRAHDHHRDVGGFGRHVRGADHAGAAVVWVLCGGVSACRCGRGSVCAHGRSPCFLRN